MDETSKLSKVKESMDDKICGDLAAVEMECLLEGEKPKFRLYVSEFFSTHRRPSIGSCSDLPFRKSEDGHCIILK